MVFLSIWAGICLHDSTLFDRVWLMIRLCLTHDSTLFDSWFDPVRPGTTHDSTLLDSIDLFDSWFVPVWPMIRLCWLYYSFDRRKFWRKLDTVWPCRPNHESNTSAREKTKRNNLDHVEISPWETVVYLMLKLKKITIVCCQKKLGTAKKFYFKFKQLTAAVFIFYNCPNNWGS